MYNFEYKKSLGQNFLKDVNVVDKIVSAIDYRDNNLVIEVGPGSGAMTKKLLNRVDFAILYEIDRRLERILSKELNDYDNYELIFDDFLKRDVIGDLARYDYDALYIVANLPYYVTTPIISKIISDSIPVDEMVIMIQKEVAERLVSKPGSREYGQITVFLNYFFEIEKVLDVSKNSFIPKPKVDSTVIRLRSRKDKEYLKDTFFFERLVKDSFRFKRKTIKNNLNGYDLEKIDAILNKYGFDINMRSECIPYWVFVEISNVLYME